MRRLSWAVYLWPGLPHLWRRGEWKALILALAFGWALSLTAVATYGYSDFFSDAARSGSWVVLGLVWLGLLAVSLRWDASPLNMPKSVPGDDAYPKALDYYLKGNWFQAERLLRERLAQEPRDLEARLTLATLLRHTRRAVDARAELDRLEKLEGAQRWVWEIQRERELLIETPAAAEEPGGDEASLTPAEVAGRPAA
jgi:hypothetical protein